MMAAIDQDLVTWFHRNAPRVRHWRSACFLGGLLLFTTFFMPAVGGCGPVVPADEAWEALKDLWNHDWTWSTTFGVNYVLLVMFTGPYLFGLLVALTCLRGWQLRRASKQHLGLSLVFLVAFASVWLTTVALWLNGPALELPFLSWLIFFSLFTLLSPLYLLRGMRSGEAGTLCLRWYAALWALAWFTMHLAIWIITDSPTYYGLWLSIVTSFVIVVATYEEVRIRAHRGNLRTCWNLLRCRLHLHDLTGPRCFTCGYLLVGLPSNRCPECGRTFNPNDYPMLVVDRATSLRCRAPHGWPCPRKTVSYSGRS